MRTFARHYPVPTYVCEFLLGRYCASIDEDEIAEGLAIVERQLRERAVRSGEEELFKSRAREKGVVKLIDLITARLDARTDSYLATLPSVQLRDVCLDDQFVKEHERMLTGGFYAEVDLAYDAVIAQEKNGGSPRRRLWERKHNGHTRRGLGADHSRRGIFETRRTPHRPFITA